MLHEFLDRNRTELIARCRSKVGRRIAPRLSSGAMEHGIPLFLDQLIQMLQADERSGADAAVPTPGPRALRSRNMGATAARHGGELLRDGFTIEQVVHDYGDLCQAITELAMEQHEPVGASEFKTLNGCLDHAIAEAVTEFGLRKDQLASDSGERAMSERLGYIAHELRNCLNTAVLAYEAIKGGHVGLRGATSEVLERALGCLRDLIDRPFVAARLAAGAPAKLANVDVDAFVTELRLTISAEAKRTGCDFRVVTATPGLVVAADKQMLYSALSNLLRNAFAFTEPRGLVTLTSREAGGRVRFEIEDECGVLSPGVADALSLAGGEPADGQGVGRGLPIARRAIEAMGGTLSARAVPSGGCMFTADLPRGTAPATPGAIAA